MRMDKKTSLAKIESNRQNAKLSTGPRTPKGKGAVRWNALKHGLLSRETVIHVGDGRESKAEFHGLLAALRDELQPEGILEEMLVEKIAVCYWRLRRVLRCEVGEIRKQLDSFEFDNASNRTEKVKNILEWASSEGHEKSLLRSSCGVEHLLQVIEGIRYDVEEHGELCPRAKEELETAFGLEDKTFGCVLRFYCWLLEGGPEKSPDEFEDYDDPPPPDECNRIILEMLDEKRDELHKALEAMKDREKLELQTSLARQSIPSADAADRILRYETSIERQLFRAVNQLERLQRQRKGEPVPPPVNVELSGEN